ncbi:MAG: 4-coumarate--CoA ligase family protein [Acidimicrobiia bacterium]|nr:4-coumarate--CoA ligase family protein [Acidimicrobiia bacterium]
MVVVTSPHPDIEVPSIPLTDYVMSDADGLSEKPAFVDGPSGRTITFGQLKHQIANMAGNLAARGLGPGDVAGILAPNVPEYVVMFHGSIKAGMTVTTVNPTYTVNEIVHQLNDAGARILFTVSSFMPQALAAATESGIEEIVVLGETGESATPYSELLVDAEPPIVEFDPATHIAVLPYSSGTTGLSKGVMLTHQNLTVNLAQASVPLEISSDDVLIGVLPFFHIYGMIVIMNMAMLHGATVVTMPRFDLVEFLELVQKYRVSVALLVPPIILALANHPIIDQYDTTSLRLVFSGAAPLGSDLADACADRIRCDVTQGYGLTEASPVTHSTPSGQRRPGSVGPALPNTESRVVDPETGIDVAPGETGELWVRGPQVMTGYLNNREATAMTIDDEGWLHTGDIAMYDDDGWFYIVDRLKELIKYKGFQVPPAELEALLITHPAVVDVAVIPKPDTEAGEVPKAFVVVNQDVTPEEIKQFVVGKIATYKEIQDVEFVDEIPKSASGKILRRVLREREG